MIIQEIIDGIITALKIVFPECKIYTEEVKQGLTTPCFILQLLNPTNEQFLGNRYYRTNLFSIQYIPKSTIDQKTECNEVIEKLFLILEYITVSGDLLRGTNMRSEYFDGILTFFVNYNLFVRKEIIYDIMNDVTIEIEVSENGTSKIH